MPRSPEEAAARRERRIIRVILALVALGWLLALGLMVLAALFWDRP